MFSVWDENLSWYYNFNILVSCVSIAENAESEFQESNRMHGEYYLANTPFESLLLSTRLPAQTVAVIWVFV